MDVRPDDDPSVMINRGGEYMNKLGAASGDERDGGDVEELLVLPARVEVYLELNALKVQRAEFIVGLVASPENLWNRRLWVATVASDADYVLRWTLRQAFVIDLISKLAGKIEEANAIVSFWR